MLYLALTVSGGRNAAEVANKAAALVPLVGDHLQHHGVAGGDQRAWPEGSTEATQLLHHVGVAVVGVQVVVATEGVRLHVHHAERQHDHVAFRHLEKMYIFTL